MLSAEKRHLTEVVIGTRQQKHFKIPYKYRKLVEEFLNAIKIEEDSVSADEALKPYFDETSKRASLLRGGRLQLGLTQTQFAKKLGTSQSALAEMELAKRSIGIKLAKKIGNLLDLDYRSFL